MAIFRILLLLCLAATCGSYRIYQDRIPNGNIVPHPCKPNFLWRGVGHINPLGAGHRNPFGKDFELFKKWSSELCQKDSDSDGRTNGEELGDPLCVWTEGSFPSTSSNITHPGVCDPWGSDKCNEINKQVTCETGEFVCPHIYDSDVFNVTLRFPPTKVPGNVTTYTCMTFELDMLEPGVDYHLIATEPFIDNSYVMHHTTLTGCDQRSRALDSPIDCVMGQSGCRQNLAVWTLGLPGECVYQEAGFKIGTNGYSRLSMQHHWTNPERKTEYIDSSGMVLYLTKKLRKYNAAYWDIGETRLMIPPGENRVTHTSSCSAGCTREIIDGRVFLMTGLNHMHYLGYKQNVEHYRNGMKLPDLTPDEDYSYDNPVVHTYNPPVELRSGDNLETTCVYRSTSRTTTTFFGEGSFDEMCFGIFTFFPAENMTRNCVEWDDVELCYMDDGVIHGCDLRSLSDTSSADYKATVGKVLENCNIEGICLKECPAALAEVRKHHCFSDKLEKFTVSGFQLANTIDGYRFMAAMRSCDGESEVKFPTSVGQESAPVQGVSLVMTIIWTLLYL